jgi:hypothetical protein
MLVAQTTQHATRRSVFTPLVRGLAGLITLRHELPHKLVYDERGRIVGRIVAPVDEQVFGLGRGTVYLTRD